MKIKTRFAHRPQMCRDFLAILHSYQRQHPRLQGGVERVRAQVRALFGGHAERLLAPVQRIERSAVGLNDESPRRRHRCSTYRL